MATFPYAMNSRKRAYLEDDEGNLDVDESESQCGSGYDSANVDSVDDDPLDAFMAGIEVQAKRDKEVAAKHEQEKASSSVKVVKSKLGRTDIENEDDEESYYRWIADHPEKACSADDDEGDIEYDEDGNPFKAKKYIDPLPPVDHTLIAYEPFEKNFYIEHDHINRLSPSETDQLRLKLGIRVSGLNPPKPVTSFGHFGFDEQMLSIIRTSEFTTPTPIQAQGIPVALSGRDCIGIAKTGSGKTMAYIWPALIHILDQRLLDADDGPIALICVPTRELAIQVYNEANKYAKKFDIKCVCVYGGGSKWEQTKALQERAEIVICTPGRLIDHIKIGSSNLRRVTCLVFDEADRMFDFGFEPQVRSIANHVRPDRQTLMFSATFKKKIERLARDILVDPIKIIQGEMGEANENIQQTVEVFKSGSEKWPWLMQHLVSFCAIGLLHGDMQQYERNEVIHAFRTSEAMSILVATDVAARGLDIPSIRTVVNYDVARDADTHIHRIGRTARAGEAGYAVTLITDKDKEFAGHLVRSLEAVNQFVSPKLLDLANQSAWFRNSRYKTGKGKKVQVGGRGLGYKEEANMSSNKGLSHQSSQACVSATPAGVSVKEALMSLKPGGDRMAALKSAFSAQFRSKFHAASAETSWQSHSGTDPTPEWKKSLNQEKNAPKKRSRWD